MQQPWNAAFEPINSNNPSEQLFMLLVQDVYGLLSGVSGLGLNAAAFALGEKLAWFRNRAKRADAEAVAELSALYQVLAIDFKQPFFEELAKMTQEQLTKSVFTVKRGRDAGGAAETPFDVQVMLPIYNAVWNVHYEEFLDDPAKCLAEWNVADPYQTRAIRAVLFDMDYDRLALLCLMMAESINDSAGEAKLAKTIRAKAQVMLSILAHREETPDSYAAQILTLEETEIFDSLPALIKSLKSNKRSKADLDMFGFVVPFPVNTNPDRK